MKAWVFRILVNESLAYLRRNKRFILVEDLPEDLVEDEDIGQKLDVYPVSYTHLDVYKRQPLFIFTL